MSSRQTWNSISGAAPPQCACPVPQSSRTSVPAATPGLPQRLCPAREDHPPPASAAHREMLGPRPAVAALAARRLPSRPTTLNTINHVRGSLHPQIHLQGKWQSRSLRRRKAPCTAQLLPRVCEGQKEATGMARVGQTMRAIVALPAGSGRLWELSWHGGLAPRRWRSCWFGYSRLTPRCGQRSAPPAECATGGQCLPLCTRLAAWKVMTAQQGALSTLLPGSS